MSRLVEWLDHRMEVVGINNYKELSELTGVTRAALREIRDIGALDILNRTQRRVLATALRARLASWNSLATAESIGSMTMRFGMWNRWAARFRGRKMIRHTGRHGTCSPKTAARL